MVGTNSFHGVVAFVATSRTRQTPPGVTRTSYGDGENFAHRLIAEWAEELSLEVLGGLLDDTFCPTEE